MHKLFLFCFALIAVCLPANSFSEERTEQSHFVPFTGRILGNKVRVRVQPTLEGYIVRETTMGELFGVVKEESDFYAVMAPSDIKGYVFRTFILDGVVEGDRVNVRLYPDVDAPIIGQLHRGDKIESTPSPANNKWLEIDLPRSSNFYIAKEYIEKCGPIEMLAQIEAKHHEANHHLNSAFHFAQAQLNRSFEEIELESITKKFDDISKNYCDLPDIAQRSNEVRAIMQEAFLQKKIAFLESKAKNSAVERELFTKENVARLGELGLPIATTSKVVVESKESKKVEIAKAASDVIGLSTPTDKMLMWAPLEDSIYHLWVAAGGERSMEEFYAEESLGASVITGIIEPYQRPVKNRPGDFILKSNDLPTAFLYSTKVNLQELVGKQVTIRATPRPNNNFAFPAYFVLSVE